jgi:hypothetical protein
VELLIDGLKFNVFNKSLRKTFFSLRVRVNRCPKILKCSELS